MTKLRQVIDRAMIDANFADNLRYQAVQGARHGRGSAEWQSFMEHFAADADQLMHFTTMEDPGNSDCTGTTGLTTTVTSTLICTLTTTTLTTSIFCEP